MEKVVLGLDIDGVLYDFHSALYTYYQYEMNYGGTYREFWLDFIANKSEEEQKYIMEIPIPYEMIAPSLQVLEFLSYAQNKADIYYITSRSPELERITRRYFRRYDFPFQDNLFMNSDKITTCRYLGITHFLDDHVKHVKKVASVANAYLMAKLWNTDSQEELKTVHSLREFKELVFND